MMRRAPFSTLFPYTPLFRSRFSGHTVQTSFSGHTVQTIFRPEAPRRAAAGSETGLLFDFDDVPPPRGSAFSQAFPGQYGARWCVFRGIPFKPVFRGIPFKPFSALRLRVAPPRALRPAYFSTSTFFFNDAASTVLYTLPLHAALPISFFGAYRSNQFFGAYRSNHFPPG